MRTTLGLISSKIRNRIIRNRRSISLKKIIVSIQALQALLNSLTRTEIRTRRINVMNRKRWKIWTMKNC